MCHPVLFGLLLGVLAAKLLRRFSGCGGCHGGRRGGRRFGGGFGARWGGGDHSGLDRDFRGAPFSDGSGAARTPSRPIEELLLGLDLNQRQKEEAQPIFDRLAEFFGRSGPRLSAALSAIAAERFDRGQVEALFAGASPEVRRDLPDGMEHVHNILIPEQREHLRARLAGSAPAAS